MADEDDFYDPENPGKDDRPEPPEATGSKEAARDGEPSNVVQHPSSTGNGKPLAERAEDPDDDDDPQLEMFIVEDGGRNVTLGSLVKKGTPIENRYVLTGKSIPQVSGGIIDPYKTSVLLVADCVVDHVKPQYIRDAQQRVEKVVLYVTLKPRRVQQALTEAGRVMIEEAAAAESKAA